MKKSKFIIYGAVCIIAVLAFYMTFGPANKSVPAVAPETIVGYVEYGEGETVEITFGDLDPAYLESGKYPDPGVRRQLQDQMFEELKAKHDGYMTTEDEVSYFALSRAEAFEYKLPNTPNTIGTVYLADIPIEYRQNGFPSEAAEYILQLKKAAKEQNLKAPHWLEFNEDYDVLCAAPHWCADLFSANNVAVKSWLNDGIPEAEVYVETGISVRLEGRFIEESEEGYMFENCYSDDPCTCLVKYDMDADAFIYKTEICEECLMQRRTWRGSLNEDMPQSFEECFEPIWGEVNPSMNIPADGDWTAYKLTCVYTGQSEIYSRIETFVNVEVYNADKINEDGTHTMGCLILRQDDGTPLWVEGAVLGEVKYDELRLWSDNASTPSVDITVWPDTNGSWVINN